LIVTRYLVQIAYTTEAWATLLKNPQNRAEAAAPLVEHLGGKIESAYMSFGKYDGILILNLPDNVSAAALAMAFSAGSAFKGVKTTPLLTSDEAVEAMRKGGAAAAASYRPPSA
jgi:uncharacterized protein with GYD domain